MQFRLTTICDDCVPVSSGLIAEHGLAILIETTTTQILFDTGQGLALLHNAEKLEKDLRQVRHVVLSHGHYDHTGGLRDLLDMEIPFVLTAHPRAFEAKFADLPGRIPPSIGSPLDRDAVGNTSADVRLATTPVRLVDGVTTTGEVPFRTDFEGVDSGFYSKTGGRRSADELPDDLSLILETTRGLVVVLGCAHRGMVNHLLQAREVTGRSDIHAVIGGAHLFRASAERVERVIAELQEMDVDRLVLGHCTGFEAMARMYAVFGDRFQANVVGGVVEI